MKYMYRVIFSVLTGCFLLSFTANAWCISLSVQEPGKIAKIVEIACLKMLENSISIYRNFLFDSKEDSFMTMNLDRLTHFS